ncbi:porin [Myroides sp. LJL115]
MKNIYTALILLATTVVFAQEKPSLQEQQAKLQELSKQVTELQKQFEDQKKQMELQAQELDEQKKTTNSFFNHISDTHLEDLPYYSYGSGLGITSKDSIFKLNIRFRMQNRVTGYFNQDEKAQYDAQIKRLRLRFDGYVGSPKFLYAIQLSFAPGDMGTPTIGQHPNIIRDAAVTYKPNNYWSIIFGQTKLPGNRQRTNSSGALELTDRSINNSKFNLDRDFGLQAYYVRTPKDKFGYAIKTAISTGRGRNFVAKQKTSSYTLTGRGELYPLGAFSKNGAFFEGDLAREITPKLMLGTTFSYASQSHLNQGQLGSPLFTPKNYTAVLSDAILKYNGWAAMVAYMNRELSDPISSIVNQDGTTSYNYVFAGHGLDYELSYMFPSHYSLIGRVSTQNMKSVLRDNFNLPNTTEYTIGVSKYIWEHAFKIQAELTYDKLDYIASPSKNNWYLRMQVEIGI